MSGTSHCAFVQKHEARQHRRVYKGLEAVIVTVTMTMVLRYVSWPYSVDQGNVLVFATQWWQVCVCRAWVSGLGWQLLVDRVVRPCPLCVGFQALCSGGFGTSR